MDSSIHVSASKDEKQTRIELINPVLFERGWVENLIREEKTPGGADIIDGSRESEGGIPMDKEAAIARVKQYAALVRQNFTVKKVILYGSHARGKARGDSDIDVAIVVPRIEGDLPLLEAKLFKLRRDIEPMIVPVLLEEDNDPSGFLAEILKTGEVIFSVD